MPELCRFYSNHCKNDFYGNVQHHKPHVHIYYNEYEASVGIDGELLAAAFPQSNLNSFLHGSLSMKMNYILLGIKLCGEFHSAKSNRYDKEAK